MTYPVAQIVASPDASAEVLFDFHDMDTSPNHKIWTTGSEFSLGGPTPTGDPGSYGGDDGGRMIAFTCYVMAASADAAQVYSQMARLLHRRTGWLHVQVSPFSQSLYFRTYKATPGALHFDSVMSPGDDTEAQVYSVELTIPCDPYAYGERVTLGPYSITNNPFATSGNPSFVTLPEVVGDAPAPVRMRVTSSVAWSGFTPLFSTIAVDGGTYAGAPVAVQAANLTAGTDTGAATVNGAVPGGLHRAISFSTDNTMTPARLTDSTTVLPPGTYRVFAWIARNDSSGTFRVQATRSFFGARVDNDPVDYDRAAMASQGSAYLDLGLFSFPFGGGGDSEANADAITDTAAQVSIRAMRTSAGASQLYVGCLVYVPVQTPRAVLSRAFRPAFGYTGLLTSWTGEWDEDGVYSPMVTSALPTRRLADTSAPTPSGGRPVLVPGATNTLTVLQQTNSHTPDNTSAANGDTVTATCQVTLSYQPQWLWLAAQ